MYQVRGIPPLTDKEKARRKQVHKERLNKIKSRDQSLYNKAPEINNAILINPRKKIMEKEHQKVLEKQNRTMLSRISKIMTAPPKVTDEDYLKMKKLCNSLKGKDTFDSAVSVKQNKEFFERLNKVGPYYQREKWEEDYQRHLIQQRFMRQVHYERPSDYQEPLEFETLNKIRNSGASTAPLPSTQGQVNKIRSLKSTHSADSCTSSTTKDFLSDYGEDAFETVGTTDSATNDFSRPESRHMNSRSDDLNKVNSMNGMFRSDSKQHPAIDSYEEETWDEFEEGAKVDNKKIIDELEKDTGTNKLTVQTFKFSRDLKIPIKGSDQKDTKKKVQFDCTVSHNNALSVKAKFLGRDSESISVSAELNLSEYGFIHFYGSAKSTEQQVSHMIDRLELISISSDNRYQLVVGNPAFQEPLAPLTETKDNKVKASQDKVVPNDKLPHNNESSINNDLQVTMDDILRSDQVEKVQATPLYISNEIKYDASYEAQYDALAGNEHMVYETSRQVLVEFIPLQAASGADSKTASRRPTSSHASSFVATIPPTPTSAAKPRTMQKMSQIVSELLNATVTVQGLEDKAEVIVKFTSKSEILKSPSVAAINIDQKIVSYIQLPSILFADDTMKREYFINLANGASIEYINNAKPTIKL